MTGTRAPRRKPLAQAVTAAATGNYDTYFLGYQKRWIRDRSRNKLARKSRRTGFTYAQSYEDVQDASAAENSMDVWFSSADETAAKEYILYCGQWAKIFNIAAMELGEIVIDSEKKIKALVIELANGRRIHALSSNPKAFRSKGGKLVLDEFAFHADGDAMWKAARPIITWGYPVRIISTLNGKDNKYYRILSDILRRIDEGQKSIWSLHTVTIEDAVAEGLADKILRRKLSEDERAQWLADEKEAVGDEDTWLQEYMCQAIENDSRWLDWVLIISCESDEAGKPEHYKGGKVTVGWDVARRRDGSIIWVMEQVGDVYWTREIVRMSKLTFAAQLAELRRIVNTYDVLRICIDQTGMGEKVVEDAIAEFGQFKVEGVLFTGPTKLALATLIKQRYQDKRTRVPPDRAVRDAHYAVRKVMTEAGNPRFDAERTDKHGHADEFWAHALALHAADRPLQPSAGTEVESDRSAYTPSGRKEGGEGSMFGRRAGRVSRQRANLTPYPLRMHVGQRPRRHKPVYKKSRSQS